MLQRQGVIAKDVAAPARQSPHRCVVVGRDGFEIVGRGNQLLRHLEVLAALLQQHPQQFDQRADAGRCLGLGRDRRRRIGIGQPLGDRGQDVVPKLPLRYPLAEAAGAGQSRDRLRRMGSDFQHRLVAHDAPARQVALLRRRLAPRRQCPQHAEKALIGPAPDAKAPPRLGGLASVDRGVDEIGHLFLEPAGPAVLRHQVLQAVVDGAQMHDIGQGILDLPLGQRPVRPVGEPRGLVEAGAGEAFDQGLVADRIAKAAHHRGHLTVEDGMRHFARKLEEDFEILARRVEHLEDPRIRHQRQ
jgi:hypothetical protein